MTQKEITLITAMILKSQNKIDIKVLEFRRCVYPNLIAESNILSETISERSNEINRLLKTIEP